MEVPLVCAAMMKLILIACVLVWPSAAQWCSPESLVASKDGKTLYVGCATGNRVEVFDTGTRTVTRRIAMTAPVSGLALSTDETRLYVTCASAKSSVRVVALKSAAAMLSLPAGHTAVAPVLSPDGALLYVCNRFDNNVSVLDTATRKELARIPVVREPAGAALTPDGKRLFVINALPVSRADVSPVAAEISVIDTAARKVTGRIVLPNGSTRLHGIGISRDGSYAAVTHLLARYQLPTTQVERGWVQTNALSLLDAAKGTLIATVLLDDVDRGAANPWAVEWSADGKTLLITHAGTHEVSVIDVPGLLAKLQKGAADSADDLAFLAGLRKRVKLQGKGPRTIVIAGNRAYAASYFSDTLESIDVAAKNPAAVAVTQFSNAKASDARNGERLFNDGDLSFQGWLSCASCHSPDARVDALNWDLLNDGIGNPKNVRSLLLSHRTPPVMSHGVREDAEAAVRSGLRYILFADRPDEDAALIDEFLKTLRPMQSPLLVNGKLSPAAQRGSKLFHDAKTACATCHKTRVLTDLKPYDVGTRNATDTAAVFDTPTLIEGWRTAPYLHDGSAATMRDVLKQSNAGDKHGRTSQLTSAQLDDLVAYLLSL